MPISPPTVGFSFGSFGDIITVLQLAWELRAALNESAGASAELRALVSDIDAFTRALQDVQANIERRRRTFRPDVVNGIAAALSRCRGVLNAIQQRIERARGQTSSSGWHRYWGTAAWSILGGKKDVDALRARLAEQLGIIQLYLSLSEANSHERVREAVAAHGTTLQSIYTIVQDIQLRFDVGVPGFKFHVPSINHFYSPFARTSLQRLREVYEAARGVDEGFDMVLRNRYGITTDDFRHRRELSFQVTLKYGLLSMCVSRSQIQPHRINVQNHENVSPDEIACFFFRDAAFSEWQVLIGACGLAPTLRRVMKTLLERPHTVGVDCNCALACNMRHRTDVRDMVWRHEATKLYTEVLDIATTQLRQLTSDSNWFPALLDAFFRWPDPEHLRLSVLPRLHQQSSTADELINMLLTSPKLPPFQEYLGWISFNSGFTIEGTALMELLVGHNLPLSESCLNHLARVTRWHVP